MLWGGAILVSLAMVFSLVAHDDLRTAPVIAQPVGQSDVVIDATNEDAPIVASDSTQAIDVENPAALAKPKIEEAPQPDTAVTPMALTDLERGLNDAPGPDLVDANPPNDPTASALQGGPTLPPAKQDARSVSLPQPTLIDRVEQATHDGAAPDMRPKVEFGVPSNQDAIAPQRVETPSDTQILALDKNPATRPSTPPTLAANPMAPRPPIAQENRLKQFSEPPTEGDGHPFAIVLMDQGLTKPPIEALSAFGNGITIAIDPTLPDAMVRMKTYRAAGHEVAIIGALSLGPNAFIEDLAAVPEALAVFDTEGVALNLVPELMDAGVGVMALRDPGIITEVPHLVFSAELDDQDQSSIVVQRFIGAAATKASRGVGPPLVLGRLRPETLTAISEWSTGRRAQTMKLVPVSTLFR